LILQQANSDPVHIRTYEPGDFFGELALLYNAPRAVIFFFYPKKASILAKTDCILFALDRQTFNHIVKDSAIKKRQKYEDFLNSWDLLTKLDSYQKMLVADGFDCLHFNKGEVILKKGDTQTGIYIVESGSVVAKNGDKIEFEYTNKSYFGEIPLLKK
jgi:cAMP-dependent protein kinase regulator